MYFENVKMSEPEKSPNEAEGVIKKSENLPQNVLRSVTESILQNVTEKLETKINRKRKRNENLEEENLKIIKACKYCHPDTYDFAKDK